MSRWDLGAVGFGSLVIGVGLEVLQIQTGRVVLEGFVDFGFVGSFVGLQCWMWTLDWLQGRFWLKSLRLGVLAHRQLDSKIEI